MLFFATMVDATQMAINFTPLIGFVLGVIFNPIISFCAYIIFWIWFKIHGIHIFSGKTWKGTLVTLVTELLPGIDSIIPGWTFFVIYTIFVAGRSEGEV